MAYTVTFGTGSNVSGSTNPTPAYPVSGLGAGRLAILVLSTAHGSTNDYLNAPGGWTQMSGSPSNFANINSEVTTMAIWYKVLDGTETPGGTITVSNAGTTGRKAALIFVVNTSGGTGWNFEAQNWVGQTTAATTIADQGVTTTGTSRLAINVITYNDRQTGGQEDYAGETGGSWIASGYYEAGNYPTISVQTCEMASSGTINGGSDASINSSTYLIWGFAIWRNAAALPDLIVEDITKDVSQLAVGKPAVLGAVIKNTGAAASPATPHRVKFEIGGSPVAFSTNYANALSVSASITVVADNSWIPAASGSLTTVATVNYTGTISESNTANNTFSKVLTVVDLPNLDVTDIAWAPASPVIGDSVVLTAVVHNGGLGSTPQGIAHVVNFYVSGNLVASATANTESLAASASRTLTADSVWLPSSAGTFALLADVNPDQLFDETDFTNNTYTENVTINTSTAAAVTKFNGRGPGGDGNITPVLADYDQFFLTQGEGDNRYLQTVPSEYLTETEGDARYLQSVPSDYITQTEADAQGMPVVELGGTGATTSPVREVNANFTLLTPSVPANYMQVYFNIAASNVTVSAPAGYTIAGSNVISASVAGVFVKRSGATQFRRLS